MFPGKLSTSRAPLFRASPGSLYRRLPSTGSWARFSLMDTCLDRPWALALQPVRLQDDQARLIVMSVGDTSPGATAGILVGDIFVSLDGVRELPRRIRIDVQNIVEAARIGQAVEAYI